MFDGNWNPAWHGLEGLESYWLELLEEDEDEEEDEEEEEEEDEKNEEEEEEEEVEEGDPLDDINERLGKLILKEAPDDELHEVQTKVVAAATTKLDDEVFVPILRLFYNPCEPPAISCEEIVLKCINEATKSIKILMFSFTRIPILEAIRAAVDERGVNVEVIVDQDQANGDYAVDFTPYGGQVRNLNSS